MINKFSVKKLNDEASEINGKEMAYIHGIMEKLSHWASIVESSDDAIISKSLEGKITGWNKGAERLYGYKAEEMIGQPISKLIPPGKKSDFPYIMDQLRQGRRIDHYETERMTKDGRIVHVSITVSPIKDSLGNIIGASKIARDITDKVEYERRKDEFVSIASHELKTPLTSQKAFGELLEMLVSKNGDNQYLPYIKKINAQTEKLAKLVEDLLDLSRVQVGKFDIAQKAFSYDKVVEEVIESMQPMSKHKIIKKGGVKKKIIGDSERIGQVLTNLLSNAIKYSPKADKILVRIKPDKDKLVTAVRDYGIGIDGENHKKIFERFYRVEGLEETYPGMGIGLHVSKEIINRHGGEIWVESRKGDGSTFYFSIPFSN